MQRTCRTTFSVAGVILAAAGTTICAAQSDRNGVLAPGTARPRPVSIVLPAGVEMAELYDTGEVLETEWFQEWHPICGTPSGAVDTPTLIDQVIEHRRQFEDSTKTVIVDTAGGDGIAGGGINIVFSASASVPASALAALAAVETYIQGLFSDPITVTISVSWQNMGSGVLGSTGSYYTSSTYTTARNGLFNGKDSNDIIQNYLPSGSTIPVRYNGASTLVTNESIVYWTRANYRATVGAVNGTAASMTFNSAFGWDFDPSNGVSGYSFRDVIAHEVGHALGFVSRVDFGASVTDMTALDIFRFQTTDGTGDYNPDSYAEWQIRPRLVDYNSPNDQHHSDLITVEYKMSDGTPYQASHFREQSANIGLMDPALSPGQTFYPNYFKVSDVAMFDAIGYDN